MAGPQTKLLTRGLRLEYVTLGWNVAGVAIAALTARSTVALAGFGLDPLIEILASVVVVWSSPARRAVTLTLTSIRSMGIVRGSVHAGGGR